MRLAPALFALVLFATPCRAALPLPIVTVSGGSPADTIPGEPAEGALRRARLDVSGPPANRRGLGGPLLAEAAAVGLSSIGFAEGGGNVKAALFATGGLLVTRDLFEVRPVTATRGHLVTIAGLTALAVADVVMERDGSARGTIVLVDLLALHAIAWAARDRSPR